MSGSTRRKLRSEISRAHNFDDADEGTAARTRPLSYDEIMLKRKSKKEVEGFEEGETATTRREETVTNTGHHSRDTHPGTVRNSREDSSRKEQKTSRAEDSSGRSKDKESRDLEKKSNHKHDKDVRNSTDALKNGSRGHGRSKPDDYSKDMESRDLENKSKRKHDRDVRNTTDALKNDSRGHGRSKPDEYSKDMESRDLENKSKHKHDKDVRNTTDALKNDSRGHGRSKPDEYSRDMESRDLEDKSKHKHEKDVRNSTDALKNDSRAHGRSKPDDYSKDIARNDHEKRHHRDSVGQDRHMERSRGALERENKRKDRSGEDEKYRVTDPLKKHDSGNRRDSEISERKEKMEMTKSRHDETRSKRRRSKSQDHVKERDRRSRSSSPKARKNVSSHGHDHGELALHSQRDRSWNHSDVDRNKMSSNGSASHHRRHGVSSSGLGGYSPRKRKTEAAVKTPSPIRSPERKSAGWDHPPVGADGNLSGSVASGTQLLSKTKSPNLIDLAAGITVAASMGNPLSAIFSNNLSAFKETTVDSVQLTQATRPMRRLYIDNIPASASEKDITECFNNFLLSSGANHIRGTRPCISCMINKEKGQALVEFLTPEDASTALSFDGRSLSGNIVKIRRPKEFVEMASGPSERAKPLERPKPSVRSKPEADVISDVVKDSPHKIFIGGIAAGLSSDRIMEIVSAFGQLKAFRFEINEDLNEPCAFLEYADQSVTLKACAGLNGMKLGGRVLTVAQAVPNTSSMENSGSRHFYGIPDHVKPLLEVPTPVLKLSNVLDQNAMKLLSETDMEEIVEDIRVECSRFGSVVSINVVKTSNMCTATETREVTNEMKPAQPQEEESMEHKLIVEVVEGSVDHDDGVGKQVEPPSSVKELDAEDSVMEFEAGHSVIEHEAGDSVKEGDDHDLAPATATEGVEAGASRMSSVDEIKEADRVVLQNCDDIAADDHPEVLDAIDCSAVEKDTERADGSDMKHQKVPIPESSVERELYHTENVDSEKSGNGEVSTSANVPELDKSSDKLQEVLVAHGSATTVLGETENSVMDESACDIGNVLEVGSVLVEFRRTEASCMAAHCLHRRVFDDRIVTVEYVSLDAYHAKFRK